MPFRIGLVGFDYPEWAGTFYPPSLPHARRLSHYTTQFDVVEINTTFYSIPALKTVAKWRAAAESAPITPPGRFLFAPKLSREITHGPTPPGTLAAAESPRGHLTDPATGVHLRRWIERIRGLEPHLGPILIQFPPRFDASRRQELHDFLGTLPRDLRFAVEFRHRSWYTSDTAAMLAHHAAAWVSMDQTTLGQVEHAPPDDPASQFGNPAARHPVVPTTDFLYVRFLGTIGQFTDRTREHLDPTPRLEWWAARLRAAISARPHTAAVYCFFDNNLTGFAPATARRFAAALGLPQPGSDTLTPPAPPLQGRLFE